MNKTFFKPAKTYNLNYLLEYIGKPLVDSDVDITSTSDLVNAQKGEISFIVSAKFSKDAQNTKATAVFCDEKTIQYLPNTTIGIVVSNPQKYYTIIKHLFYPAPRSNGVIDPLSTVHSTASVGRNVELRAGVVIAQGATIGDEVVLCENVVIGKDVVIGDGTVIGANTVVQYATIGIDCNIHCNVTIGSRGFGFIPNPEKHIDIPQTGGVEIGNMIEIGAGTCIDRGAEYNTIIEDNCRLDNLVHIAHNAKIGKGCILAGQVGFAGSVTVGSGVMFGGQVGVSSGVEIGDNAVLMGHSGVARNVPAGEVYAGFPARPYKQWLKESIKQNKKEKNDDK